MSSKARRHKHSSGTAASGHSAPECLPIRAPLLNAIAFGCLEGHRTPEEKP